MAHFHDVAIFTTVTSMETASPTRRWASLTTNNSELWHSNEERQVLAIAQSHDVARVTMLLHLYGDHITSSEMLLVIRHTSWMDKDAFLMQERTLQQCILAILFALFHHALCSTVAASFELVSMCFRDALWLDFVRLSYSSTSPQAQWTRMRASGWSAPSNNVASPSSGCRTTPSKSSASRRASTSSRSAIAPSSAWASKRTRPRLPRLDKRLTSCVILERSFFSNDGFSLFSVGLNGEVLNNTVAWYAILFSDPMNIFEFQFTECGDSLIPLCVFIFPSRGEVSREILYSLVMQNEMDTIHHTSVEISFVWFLLPYTMNTRHMREVFGWKTTFWVLAHSEQIVVKTR